MKPKTLIKFRDELKKHILEGYGKKCKKRNIYCIVCSSWRMFEDFDAFVKNEVEIDEFYKDVHKFKKLQKSRKTK